MECRSLRLAMVAVLFAACTPQQDCSNHGMWTLFDAHAGPVDASHDDAADALPVRPPPVEVCGNGLDDNGDGHIDERCPCGAGEHQRCYGGLPWIGGVGACGLGVQTCNSSGGQDAWGDCAGALLPTPERCDGLDNDCNGIVDDDCPCDPLAPPACYGGPEATRNVGACHDGQLRCAGANTGDVPQPPACLGQTLPAPEICDGIDNDCNGAIDDIEERCDGIDNNCDGIVDEGCGPHPLALRRFMGAVGSGILPGDTASLYVPQPNPTGCSDSSQVMVEVSNGVTECVSPPPANCPGGQRPMYDHGAWSCVDCAFIVQFGSLYAGERACAAFPQLECSGGLVITFDATTKTWVCARPCSGQYDPVHYGRLQICVPC